MGWEKVRQAGQLTSLSTEQSRSLDSLVVVLFERREWGVLSGVKSGGGGVRGAS